MRRHDLSLSSVTLLGLQIQLRVFEQTASPLDYRAYQRGDKADRVSPDLIASLARSGDSRTGCAGSGGAIRRDGRLPLHASHLSLSLFTLDSTLVSPSLRDVYLPSLTIETQAHRQRWESSSTARKSLMSSMLARSSAQAGPACESGPGSAYGVSSTDFSFFEASASLPQRKGGSVTSTLSTYARRAFLEQF